MVQSIRLRVMTWGARHFVRPLLARSGTPETADASFTKIARLVFREPPFVCYQTQVVDGRLFHWIRVHERQKKKVVLYFHGGAYLSGSGRTHRGMLARIAKLTGLMVCAPDYRLLQEAPFPAAFDDARNAWTHLIALGYEPSDIVLGGDSAGGGLMLALLADLTQRGEMPAAAFAFSPWTDLTLSGDTLHCKSEAILPVARMQEAVEMFMGGAAPDDPRASPLFADFHAPPPVLIQVGLGEALAADARRMAEKLSAAGGQVDLQEIDTDFHVFQILDGWLPEARVALQDVANFINPRLLSTSPGGN